jgi:hypothetical protein
MYRIGEGENDGPGEDGHTLLSVFEGIQEYNWKCRLIKKNRNRVVSVIHMSQRDERLMFVSFQNVQHISTIWSNLGKSISRTAAGATSWNLKFVSFWLALCS